MLCTLPVFACLTRMLEEVPDKLREEWDSVYWH